MAVLERRRPTCPVPQDRAHEFLSEWLPKDDIDFQKWKAWFQAARIKYTVRVESMTLNGHTGQFYMIYTHRMMLDPSGRASYWCCTEEL